MHFRSGFRSGDGLGVVPSKHWCFERKNLGLTGRTAYDHRILAQCSKRWRIRSMSTRQGPVGIIWIGKQMGLMQLTISKDCKPQCW